MKHATMPEGYIEFAPNSTTKQHFTASWKSLLSCWAERWEWWNRSQNQLPTHPSSSWTKLLFRRWNPLGVWRGWLHITSTIQSLGSFIFRNHLKMCLKFEPRGERIFRSGFLAGAKLSWWSNRKQRGKRKLPTKGKWHTDWRSENEILVTLKTDIVQINNVQNSQWIESRTCLFQKKVLLRDLDVLFHSHLLPVNLSPMHSYSLLILDSEIWKKSKFKHSKQIKKKKGKYFIKFKMSRIDNLLFSDNSVIGKSRCSFSSSLTVCRLASNAFFLQASNSSPSISVSSAPITLKEKGSCKTTRIIACST